VVSPSLVTGRYVQLLPPWRGGPELADGAVIPLARTAVPLGVDDLTRTATELAKALGPNGANRAGALSDALTIGARNLDGNGQALHDTIAGLGGLSGTLAGSSADLFGTVTELETFTSGLARSDGQVREFNGRLADVTGFLAAQRGELGGALADLSWALGDVAGFVKDNRAALHRQITAAEVPVGLVALAGQHPVGWTRVAPRSQLPGVLSNRALRRILADDPGAWWVTCFVVDARYRGHGVGQALLTGAVSHARNHGASAVEGHPVDVDRLAAPNRTNSTSTTA